MICTLGIDTDPLSIQIEMYRLKCLMRQGNSSHPDCVEYRRLLALKNSRKVIPPRPVVIQNNNNPPPVLNPPAVVTDPAGPNVSSGGLSELFSGDFTIYAIAAAAIIAIAYFYKK